MTIINLIKLNKIEKIQNQFIHLLGYKTGKINSLVSMLT